MAMDRSALSRIYATSDLTIVGALGSWLLDHSGRRYLDMEAGTWCAALGHGHPVLMQRAGAQMKEAVHLPKRFGHPIVEAAAQELGSRLPGDAWRITFLSSGSEAMEFAIRVARETTGKRPLIAFEGSYLSAFGAGRDLAAGNSDPNFLLLPSGVNPAGPGSPAALDESVDLLVRQQTRHGPAAALVVESLLVSAGMFRPATRVVAMACEHVQYNGGLVIANEVTTGLGRTGLWFGFQHYPVQPDIVVLGKALGNGFPVSAVAVRADLEEILVRSGFHYMQSHVNDPFGCAVAFEVLRVLAAERLIEKGAQSGNTLGRELVRRQVRWPAVRAIRGLGLAWALELEESSDEMAIWRRLLRRGLYTGVREGRRLLRLLPPLTISTSEIDLVLTSLDEVLNEGGSRRPGSRPH